MSVMPPADDIPNDSNSGTNLIGEKRFTGYTAAATGAVNGAWRVLPLMIYVPLAVCTLLTSFGIGVPTSHFEGRCLLYARPSLSIQDNGTFSLLETRLNKWGSTYVCSLAEYLPIFAFIFAGVWFFFFCMCGKGGKGSSEGFAIDNPWRIVFPALAFHFGMMIGALVCSSWISEGINFFCRSMLEDSDGEFRCEDMDSYVFSNYDKVSRLHSWLLMANVGGWLMFTGYFLLTALLLLRCLCRPDLKPVYTEVVNDHCDNSAAADHVVTRRVGSVDSFLSAGSAVEHRSPDNTTAVLSENSDLNHNGRAY